MVAMSQAETRDELVLAHQGMARATALAFARRHNVPPDDACQEAYVALLVAADRYDPRRGASFFTFAVWVIRGALTAMHRTEYRHAHPAAFAGHGVDARGRQKMTWARQNIVELDVTPADAEDTRAALVESSLPTPEEFLGDAQMRHAAGVALQSAIRARKRNGKWRGKVDRAVLDAARRLL